MSNRVLDFSSFGEELWRIADVFRDDTLKTTEYLEEFSYFFFLKLWDDRERAEQIETEQLGEVFIPYLPEHMRFYAWAEDPDAAAAEHGFESVVSFVNDLFDRLSHIGDVVEIKDMGRTYFPVGYTLIAPGYVRLPATTTLALREGVFNHDEIVRVERNLNLFRRLFQNHTLRVRYDPTIRELCKRLIPLEIQAETDGKWDKLGRAYEFVVNKLGEQKQYGQYFTPRHIVDRIVQVVDPEPGELVYDPAAGTGGFIARVFEYVQGKIDRQVTDHVRRETMLRALKEDHLWGVEKAPDVFKLGLMNMILHGDGSTHLEEADSLSNRMQEDPDYKDRFDVVVANPPFGKTAQERTAQFQYHIKLYEALFTQHIYNSLKPGGRAGFVIKEGLLFDSKTALRNIRKRLVDRFQVLAVISLPNGVFNPYSGAKTSVLVIRRPGSREDKHPTGRVWFYEVESDGRDLGATRRPLPDYDRDGDLADMVACFPYRFRNGYPALKPGQDMNVYDKKWWWVDLETIRANDYNLTVGRYDPNPPDVVEHEDPRELINRLLELEAEIRSDLEDLLEMISVPQSAALLGGAFPFLKVQEEHNDG